MKPPYVNATLLLCFPSIVFSQRITPTPACAVVTDSATYLMPPLTYPMTSDRYAVQYKLGNGNWTTAQVYVSYYGGTNSSPYLPFSGYTALETSMSFVSIPAGAGTAVALQVTKLWGSAFPAINNVSVRPVAKGIQVNSVSGSTVQLSTSTRRRRAAR